MNEGLYREESLKRVNSPEQDDDYIVVSHPSIWLVIIVAVILLASFFVWGYFAKIPTRLPAVGIVSDGELTMFLPPTDVLSVAKDMEVLIDGVPHSIKNISDDAFSPEELKEQYNVLSNYNLKLSEWNFAVKADALGIADGVKSVNIVTNHLSPMEYLMLGQTIPQVNTQQGAT